ncbi:hypothetical protein ANN_26039 [Periplaneta americana]|uniref:Uncharacterized protein n=1 Tax=Periplaneta americana TaxID=6978 RepID=A0ABQ8S4U3_PERAM|nr:hypothetical protein ANN_26039 [Periplaneta americana]
MKTRCTDEYLTALNKQISFFVSDFKKRWQQARKTEGVRDSPALCTEILMKGVVPKTETADLVHLPSPQNIDTTRVKICGNETTNKTKIQGEKRNSAKRKCVGVIKESPKKKR